MSSTPPKVVGLSKRRGYVYAAAALLLIIAGAGLLFKVSHDRRLSLADCASSTDAFVGPSTLTDLLEHTKIIVVGRTVESAGRAAETSHGPIIEVERIVKGYGIKQGQRIGLCWFADHIDFGKQGDQLLLFLSGFDEKADAYVAAWGSWGEMAGMPGGRFRARFDTGEQVITAEDVITAL